MRGIRSSIVFLAVLLIGGTALAQTAPFSVVVTPERATIAPGEGVQFEAQLFDVHGKPVDFDDFKWLIKPDSLGEISDDGFFVAGRMPGEVVVIAVMRRGGVRYIGEALVVIGPPPPPTIKIVVSPEEVVVPPGERQRFKVTAVARSNAPIRIDKIRWLVEPQHLGDIDHEGVFTAGQHAGQGHVIALVEVGDAVFRGAAQVTVSDPPTAAISGQVTDETTGAPLIGAIVRVQRLGPIHWSRVARTDSTGTYTVRRLIPGLYVVHAGARDYLPEYYDGVEHLFEATVLQVSSGDSLTGIDFQLGHGGSISGLVASEMDSLPIPHAVVTAIHVVTHRKRHAVADENGRYVVGALPAGDYAVTARAAGYRGEFYDNATNLNEATILRVNPPDSIKNIDFYLGLHSAITGTVTDAEDGTPIARALVRIFRLTDGRMHSMHPVFTAVTDANGEYIASVPPGTYIVHASARGYLGEYYDDAANFRDATKVEVLADQHTTGIDFDLERLGSISGVVRDEATGEPIASATVVAFWEVPVVTPMMAVADGHNVRHQKALTDSLGRYTLEGLHPGKYYVMAAAPGYLPEFYKEAANLRDATPVEISDTTRQVTGIDFTLSSGGSIEGVVHDADDSTGIGGALVTVEAVDHRFRRHTYTDRDGSYIFKGLPDGEYILYAKAKGYHAKFYDGANTRDQATPVKVENGAAVTNIDFYLPRFHSRFGTIAGVVTEPADSLSTEAAPVPIAGAFVIAIPIGNGVAHFDFTDPFGNYRITNLAPGEYVVLAWAPGHLAEFYDDARHWKDATRIKVGRDEVIEGIDFELEPIEPGPYHIRGVVRRGRGPDRRPVQGAVVYALIDGRIAGSAVTDENGEFFIEGLASGRYKVRASGVGIMDAEAQNIDVGGGQSAENLEIDTEEVTTSISGPSAVPQSFELLQNYPNPFNPETTIRFAVPKRSHVKLQVYNLMGQVVRTLVDRTVEAGFHSVQWDGTLDNGRRAASGIYLLRFEAEGVTQARRMVLMK